MRRFFRTVGGKLLLFACCVLCLCLLAASAALGILLLNEPAFYTRTEAEVRASYLARPLQGYGLGLVHETVFRSAEEDPVGQDWGNAVWQVQDASGNVLRRSESADAADSWDFSFDYGYSAANGELHSGWSHSSKNLEGMERYTVSFSLMEGLPMLDELAMIALLVHVGWTLRYAVFFIGLLALGLSAAAFVGLMCVSARRPGTEELCPGPLYRFPFDLLLALCAGLFLLLCLAADELARTEEAACAAVAVLGFLGANLILGLSMSAAGRVKGRVLLRNTVVGFCLRGLLRLLRRLGGVLGKLPLVWRTALVFAGVSLLEGIVLAASWPYADGWAFFWACEKLVLFPLILALALQLRRLQKGGEALAAGDLAYQTGTRGMLPALRRHGEDLNRIAAGMSAAVEQRLRSERMKTELITNVSHDLKTPLTSLVNYAELIGREAPAEGKLREYAEVLLRQSERLKRLIEDLVEASKASTGNLEVTPEPCEASVFLTQAAGEYEEKLAAAELTLVTKTPEKELHILADGRRMQRIFDNLMGNILKYALPGTRVYLSLEEQDGEAVFSFKNTSREMLDLPASELMERFVRGDAARSSEGSGLGLSIAGSLAELQGGSLRIFTDGDLFKAMLRFPLVLIPGDAPHPPENECS